MMRILEKYRAQLVEIVKARIILHKMISFELTSLKAF